MYLVHQNPTDPDFVQNPYDLYEEMRAQGDLVYWADYDMPVAVSAAAVDAILKSKTMGRAPPERRHIRPGLEEFRRVDAHSLLELEPPDHTRLRRLVQHAFSTRRIAAMALDISTLTFELIEALPRIGQIDLIHRFCRPLPARVITRLIGLPDSDAKRLQSWSNAMVAMYQARRDATVEEDANAAARAFAAHVRAAIETKRAQPGADLLSDMIAVRDQGDHLSEDEMISTAILLLNAGHEATVHTLGNGVKTLLERKTPAAVLEPTAVESTVEEILRYDPPLHMFTRFVYEDTDIAGHTLKAGTEVGCLLAAANRDPKVWPASRHFDTTRKVTRNASFGAGIHFCLGAALARLELQVALPALFTRCPHMKIVEPPRYSNTYHFHGLERLMVTL